MAELPKEKPSAVSAFLFLPPDESGALFRVKESICMYSMITIGQVLQTKGHDCYALSTQATAYEALEIMADKKVGALLVIEGGKLVGVFSERDYARKVILKGKSSKTTTVGELMSSPPICAAPALTIRDCMAIMTGNHIRHLPIVDKGTTIGIVSMGDIVKTIICEHDTTIQALENYVAGNEYGAQVYCP
jgi:signal-transduction protein with cAMP-binding, CBS, and nucleotidyltransferase domain